MTTIRRFTVSTEATITAIAFDDAFVNYLWIAYGADSDGNCHLKKVSPTDLTQVYFDVEVACVSIDKIIMDNTYIYFLVTTSTGYRGYRKQKISPVISSTSQALVVTAAPVDMVKSGDYLYVLVAGESGDNTQILKYNTIFTLQETIDLDYSGVVIDTASSLIINEDTNDFWIITDDSPTQLVRVWEDGGWRLDVTYMQG